MPLKIHRKKKKKEGRKEEKRRRKERRKIYVRSLQLEGQKQVKKNFEGVFPFRNTITHLTVQLVSLDSSLSLSLSCLFLLPIHKILPACFTFLLKLLARPRLGTQKLLS